MTITSELKKAYEQKASCNIEEFLLSIRQIILENTPKSLHARINEKFKQLKIDESDYVLIKIDNNSCIETLVKGEQELSKNVMDMSRGIYGQNRGFP